MSILTDTFNTILYRPLFNVLILLYEYLPGGDFGIAVIVLTVLIRLLLYPLMLQSIRSQRAFSQLQPKVQEIQKKFKDNQQKQAEELMNLYREEKISPFSGLLPALIQLPLLIALYQVFWKGLRLEEMNSLYNFIPHPGIINPTFLGLIDLSQANVFLAVLAGTTQFFQTKTLNPKIKKSTKKGQMSEFSEIMQKQTLYFLPVLSVIILLRLPSAIALYWIISSLFSMGQQYISKNHVNPK